MISVDVAVVGAGPAGCAAAIASAGAGRSAVVLDRAVFPRDKCCGDGLTTGALRVLERLGVDPRSLPSWADVRDVVVRSPSGRSVTFPLPPGPGVYAGVARRAELDAALVRRAREVGVEVLEGQPLTGAHLAADHVVLESAAPAGGVRIAARYVIGADGAWSPLRKALDPSPVAGYLGDWHAFRQYFTGVSGPASRRLFVWFEPDLLPGYVWAFPLAGGRANVGFGIHRGGAVATRDMKQLWPEVLARPHVRAALGDDATAEAPHRAWPIPARIGKLPLTAAGGRALFVGDAAAATDPLTGEGIAQALLTGELAAAAVAGAGPFAPDVAAATYTAAVRRELAADDAMSRLLVRAIRHRKGARAALRVAGLTPWTRRSFARWLFEDYPRAFVVTPRRWPEHSFTGPGAFSGDAA